MANKKTWKRRALEAQQLLRASDELIEYHKSRHGEAAEKLQAVTTSPDTKAAHEAGYRNGLADGIRRGGDLHSINRKVNLALAPGLMTLDKAEHLLGSATLELSSGFQRVQDILEGKDEPAPEGDLAQDLSILRHPDDPSAGIGGTWP